MSMWPEPELEDTVLPDGRRWQHVRRAVSRIDLAQEMAMEIENLGTFLIFDPHETEAFFVLRDAAGRPQCVARISHNWPAEVRGHYGRPATAEEQKLAEEISEIYGATILREAGFEVPGEASTGGPRP